MHKVFLYFKWSCNKPSYTRKTSIECSAIPSGMSHLSSSQNSHSSLFFLKSLLHFRKKMEKSTEKAGFIFLWISAIYHKFGCYCEKIDGFLGGNEVLRKKKGEKGTFHPLLSFPSFRFLFPFKFPAFFLFFYTKKWKRWKLKRRKKEDFSVDFLPNFIFQKIYCEDFDGSM